MLGDDKILCSRFISGNAFPVCACPAPSLSDGLFTMHDCSLKFIGEVCMFKCKENFSLFGNSSAICQNNTVWTSFPSCKKMVCNELKLPNVLSFKEDCSLKSHGEQCQLKCKEGGNLIGSNSVTCINNTSWSTLPKCTCPLPPLHKNMKAQDDCSNKLIENGLWGPLPTCRSIYCIQPKLPNTLSFAEDCSSKLEGESCLLKCKEGLELIGSNKIVCVNSNEWSAFPNCICPVPPLTEDMVTAGTCKNKIIGETCYVSCKAPFVPIGSKNVTCQENGRWGPLPQCKVFLPHTRIPFLPRPCWRLFCNICW
ncbi:sushi, von Willebrand factor type A, EGF and pentraxin domain-containing protein 1 [Caerostris extrusa]|uniref:Sushi, von Willebrand factor type A, EGF and pentraxin domain-containing protein 1 n=1 Tax=Caerostris extrusa TaxID=172846 RepID=A0AAV4Y5Y4_CAEEX|nr:sushi, von Willebrand factor type A, EGF and pentraxin domain-containing protein 1 [Caerostris extrusa]